MLGWNEFIKILGCSQLDRSFISLPQVMNELPIVEPDMLGIRHYYSFIHSGVLFLLENEKIDQISFFIEPSENFSKYNGELPVKSASDRSENEIIDVLGPPSSSGGGEKADMLLGYMNRWIKYDENEYALHLEFNQSGALSKISLMAQE
ncbi:hypothetical protein ACUTSW_18120 [Serratia sp. TSA_198.1]|uniref:hypothetical protein n=1 Tax=Serratia sp. TSA_198.1 TaxID=3415664 RepID=UPI0040458829